MFSLRKWLIGLTGDSSFLEKLRSRLRQIPLGQAPAPWRGGESYSVGGLIAVGFAPQSDRLLVISWQGRGLFDCISGTRIARDEEPPVPAWFDQIRLLADGIGSLSGQRTRLAGLYGGALPRTTDDRWAATQIAPDWPLEAIILEPPGSSILIEDRAKGSVMIATNDAFRAYGFSETGLSFVVATSDHIQVWRRDRIEPGVDGA